MAGFCSEFEFLFLTNISLSNRSKINSSNPLDLFLCGLNRQFDIGKQTFMLYWMMHYSRQERGTENELCSFLILQMGKSFKFLCLKCLAMPAMYPHSKNISTPF